MEHNTILTDKKFYVAMIVAVLALIIGAIGLVVGLIGNTSQEKTVQPYAAPGGAPGPTDRPLYRSHGSSDSGSSETKPQDLVQ